MAYVPADPTSSVSVLYLQGSNAAELCVSAPVAGARYQHDASRNDQSVTRVAALRLIVGARFPAYLMAMVEGSAMPDGVAAVRPRLSRALLAAAAGFAVLLAGTIVLWVHYGTAVFYEMILAGIAACF